MTKSTQMNSLLDRLKVQVLLYSGSLIEYQQSKTDLSLLLNTAVDLKHPRVDKLLLSIEAEGQQQGCGPELTTLLLPIHQRAEGASSLS